MKVQSGKLSPRKPQAVFTQSHPDTLTFRPPSSIKSFPALIQHQNQFVSHRHLNHGIIILITTATVKTPGEDFPLMGSIFLLKPIRHIRHHFLPGLSTKVFPYSSQHCLLYFSHSFVPLTSLSKVNFHDVKSLVLRNNVCISTYYKRMQY